MPPKRSFADFKKNTLIFTLVVLVLIGVVVWLIVSIGSQMKSYQYIGRPEAQRDTITISGTGKVTAIPDIANIRLGISTEKKEIEAAQLENTQKMNLLIAELKKFGIKEEDIQTTNYSIYPRYDYQEGKTEIRGYEVNQQVTVKIRNLDIIGNVLTKAGQIGANQVGGLQFTIDDPEEFKKEVRKEALKNAREKAEAVASVSGIKLGKIVSFSEREESFQPPVPYFAREEALGLGGAAAPDIQAGSVEVTINVTVGYEIK